MSTSIFDRESESNDNMTAGPILKRKVTAAMPLGSIISTEDA